ncbi:MAG: ornithine racemase Orr [Thermotaleaceae bacterium]
MSLCPRINIDLEKIRHNARTLTECCNHLGIQVAGVTKAFSGTPEIAAAFIEGGVSMLADSRIENLKKLNHLEIPKILLRLPMISQIGEVVQYADISLNSELKTIEKLSAEALRKKKKHQIILMVDLGDLREGILEENLLEIVGRILKLEGIILMGLGTNLTCYGGVIPNKKNLGRLVKMTKTIEKEFKIKFKVLSGGNSSSWYLIENGDMPKEINHLRLGEAILLGRETAFGNTIPNTYQDAFIFTAEIIELKEKPSLPMGEIGMDAFGNKPHFEDRGIRKRGILAAGKQDVVIESLTPIDEDIELVGGSSDHLLIDITNSKKKYEVGDQIDFYVGYGALLQLITSEYVCKNIINYSN